MNESRAGRQRQLVAHYLVTGASTLRLQETVALAAGAVGFPHAQVNIVDDTLLYTIGEFDAGGAKAVPRQQSMCQYTVDGDRLIAVNDLRLDSRSRTLPGVLAGMAASYLGVPLHSREAAAVGTLCFFDSRPRHIHEDQIDNAYRFALLVEEELELVRRARERRLQDHAPALELTRAVQRGQVRPWFQPIVDLRSGQVVSYEALARWERPEGPILDPTRLMSPGEDDGLIVDLNQATITVALEHFALWRRSRPELRLNLNISTQHLQSPGSEVVHDMISAAGVQPTAVTFELSHGPTIDDAALLAPLSELGEHGYRIVLDGFGTTWSSIESILDLPMNGIKIDAALSSAFRSPTGSSVARSLVTLQRELDLEVNIDGIVDVQTAELARDLGFQHGQGGLWAPPRRPAEMLRH